MYRPEDRQRLRDALLAAARQDQRITGAALTGSAAVDREDRWSDIDLAFGLAAGVAAGRVVADWTDRLYRRHGAVHHTDMTRGGTLYRVFLLADTLQVDIAFAPADEFGAIAPTFRLVFGAARDLPAAPPPEAATLVGLGWLYALHARSSIARGRVWQAEYMISGLRDQVLALSCLRHGVPAAQGRGMDDLPAEVTAPIVGALVRSLNTADLRRAFRAAAEALLVEAGHVDPALVDRLAGPVGELADLGVEQPSGQIVR
ncbi:MAG: hypothetical protein WCA46_28270 [Actinocatenispora sp.]